MIIWVVATRSGVCTKVSEERAPPSSVLNLKHIHIEYPEVNVTATLRLIIRRYVSKIWG